VEEKVVIVHLRRPRGREKYPGDKRSDPFWEFGSFGLTGCHGKNLLHPNRMYELRGARLAFAQGGKLGMRLVYVTPPVRVRQHKNRVEVLWSPSKPFRYDLSPPLIDNHGETNFPCIKKMIASVNRDTWVRKFSSKFRTNCEPLADSIAGELLANYDCERHLSPQSRFATLYQDALPTLPPLVDNDRPRTYNELLLSA